MLGPQLTLNISSYCNSWLNKPNDFLAKWVLFSEPIREYTATKCQC